MGRGSQLSQLKSALSQAGLTGQPPRGKKRKRAPSEKDNAKKAAKLSEIQAKLNPFDVKVVKLKHDVGGRKLKGVAGRPAQSKQAGIEQRKRTLLKEYQERGHAGGVIDRRFGENDPSMSLEERMLQRFTKERQKALRGAIFNLEDEDELTHYGQSLSKLDDFDNVGLRMDGDDDEDEPGQIDRDTVAISHFGGFDADKDEDTKNTEKQKSKSEVMAEVIAKSKEHKLRRQLERDRDDNIRHQLDEEFASIRQLLLSTDPDSAGHTGPAAAKTVEVQVESAGSVDVEYDQHVRELAFDQRAQAKDRTKTEEEIAAEQKEILEKAERRRQRRMMGVDHSDSENEEGTSKGKRKRGGDDLEDDFYEEELNSLGAGLNETGPVSSAESSDGEEDGGNLEGGTDPDEDEEGSDGSRSFSSSGDELEDQQELVSAVPRPNGKKSLRELPYTFPCPSNHEEFLDILDGVNDDDIPTVVSRIRVLYHPSLAPDNKLKLQELSTVLIDHILYIASSPSLRLPLISSLLPHISALTRNYPIRTAECFVAKLSLMHKNFKRGLSLGALDSNSKTWPGLPELTMLRVIGTIWPASDMNHIVISPARILMGAYLGLGRVRSLSDIASGLFLCTLFLQYEQLSKRLVPEAVNFVVNAILHLAPHDYRDVSELPGSFPSPDFRSELCRPLSIDGSDVKELKKVVVGKADISALLDARVSDCQAKVDLLAVAIKLTGRFAELYKGIDGFIELFEPVLVILQELRLERLPRDLKASVGPLQDACTRLLKFARQARKPLRLQAHKPIPIPTYVPKFDSSSSSYLRHHDPDKERNEASKLRRQYKQERKGAIRELRKDARFLAAVQQEEQKEKDRAYHERMKRVFTSIESERAEQKAMEREKAKERRRAGRK